MKLLTIVTLCRVCHTEQTDSIIACFFEEFKEILQNPTLTFIICNASNDTISDKP